jgi:hypothetical protein
VCGTSLGGQEIPGAASFLVVYDEITISCESVFEKDKPYQSTYSEREQ